MSWEVVLLLAGIGLLVLAGRIRSRSRREHRATDPRLSAVQETQAAPIEPPQDQDEDAERDDDARR